MNKISGAPKVIKKPKISQAEEPLDIDQVEKYVTLETNYQQNTDHYLMEEEEILKE